MLLRLRCGFTAASHIRRKMTRVLWAVLEVFLGVILNAKSTFVSPYLRDSNIAFMGYTTANMIYQSHVHALSKAAYKVVYIYY
ncbi:hypothetical protein BDU57DRAFT_59138 [Ampelomyces quisqualis]|uniref:Uncharacterized protein n=1 Tax=Ampelomyces quisqualis TaxID=50730 RepID=A0A6A5R3W5_AMPQU|nr:hypothetical protein BDU57DRAFT_59138 [Ampelomyces quisqualis]